MPIIIGNKPIFRIKMGTTNLNIREVRKGTDLTWGLYEITYVNRGPKKVDVGWGTNKNIPNYVWGYPNQSKQDFYLYVPDNATAAEAKAALGANYGYKSHSDGWFEDNSCFTFFPAITKDFHKDLTLFCKWRQRKFCFNGTYVYEKDDESTYDIYVFKKKNGSGGYEDGYYDEDKKPIQIDGEVINEEEVG